MKKNRKTLNKQFSTRILIIMLLVAVASSGIQMVMMNNKIGEDVNREANTISSSIQQGIKETNLASKEIEHQIDLKIESYSKYIADILNKRPVEEITNEDLKEIRDSIGIAGISLFQRKGEDIVGVRSTEPSDIGFSFKEANPSGFDLIDQFMNGNITDELKQSTSYTTKRTSILYISQSGSHDGEPLFYKYAYHKAPGTDYLIDPYIKANEVYQFIKKVGPDSWIKQMKGTNEYVTEIAVLDPRVFADPSLSKEIYPPLKKVINGEYRLHDKKDTEILINMMENQEEKSYIGTYDSQKIYKSFLPMEDGSVIYVALDYDKMTAPYHRLSLILILSGFIALLALFILTTGFFNKIYINIQKIVEQIRSLEKGDFTARSSIKDKGELGQLSQTTNIMAETLNTVLSQTREQAVQTERHAYLLESEANNSVEKVYTMSMEATTEIRESTDEIDYFIDKIEQQLNEKDGNDQETRANLSEIRKLVQKHSNSTTEMTITLSDLLKSLHGQSASLSEISKSLLKNLEQFDLNDEGNADEE